jgi:hypothetical protein
MFYNQMFSKIILAALCSTAVSGLPGTPNQTEQIPITVIPGCINLFAGK